MLYLLLKLRLKLQTHEDTNTCKINIQMYIGVMKPYKYFILK